MNRALKDRYGFLFWFRWILWFAASFLAAAWFWTFLLKAFFGALSGPALTVTWTVCVFGSWFLIMIPFMRKKEEIWKRLNDDQEKAVDAWLLGMGIFIGLLAASCLFWTFQFKFKLQEAFGGQWMKAVLVSWSLILLPFLVFLYLKADRIFKEAVIRQTGHPAFQSFFIEKSRRLLPPRLVENLKPFKEAMPNGHVVNAILEDGGKIPYLFIKDSKEVAGVYDEKGTARELFLLGFDVKNIVALESLDLGQLPPQEESRWIRFDF